MNLTKMYWMFFKFLLLIAAGILQMFPAVAAESASDDLTCNVTQQPDGLFRYQLSKPPGSASCQTDWEDVNKTAIVTQDGNFDPNLVQNVTNQSIYLRFCLDHLHYRNDCLEGFKETNCTVNCSSFSDKFPGNLPVNSTLICFSKSLCLELEKSLLVIAGIILLVLAPIVVLWVCHRWKLFKCRRGGSAAEITSYTAAKNEVKIVMH